MKVDHNFTVGTLCSMVIGTDSYAAIVVGNPTPKTVVVQDAKVEIHDWLSQEDTEIFNEVDPLCSTTVFTQRRNGMWVEKGYSCKNGIKLSARVRHYMDPHF